MELKPVEPVQMSVYQSNTYREDLKWLQFDDRSRFKRGIPSKRLTVDSPAYPFL